MKSVNDKENDTDSYSMIKRDKLSNMAKTRQIEQQFEAFGSIFQWIIKKSGKCCWKFRNLARKKWPILANLMKLSGVF